MRVDAFDFSLPEELIALRPQTRREEARLLVVDGGAVTDRRVGDLPVIFQPGDVLVVNNTKVIPAQLRGLRPARATGGGCQDVAIDITVHKRLSTSDWAALVRPAKRLKEGDRLDFGAHLSAQVLRMTGQGAAILRFNESGRALDAAVHAVGKMPLPPYIASRRAVDEQDRRDYQTAYASREGAIAAPTAGLHFTPTLLSALKKKGVEIVEVTLHVGAGTFLPVKVADTRDHVMHAEWGEVSDCAAQKMNQARRRGKRLIAGGTTTLRLLETAARPSGVIEAFSGETAIFITPGYTFKSADLLLTNFHLPRSTLFMLVSAFAGSDAMKGAYAHAIKRKYRFYSYGDACLLGRPGALAGAAPRPFFRHD